MNLRYVAQNAGLVKAMIIKESKSKELYISAWIEGMRHLHWFKEPKVFDYNSDEMMEELQRNFGKPENIFLQAVAGRSKKVIGVLGLRLEGEVGVLRRWEPAVPHACTERMTLTRLDHVE